MKAPFLHRLYVRIWLAVLASVVLLTLGAGWLVRAERERADRPGREIVLRDGSGAIIGQAPARQARVPGQGMEFQVPMNDGSVLHIQLPRPHAPGGGPGQRDPRAGGLGFAWLLGLIAVAVALGAYPVVRRLTRRLEALDAGVRRWGEGDLGQRLPEDGQDEVAALARAFNGAAARVQALLASHKALLANASHELRSPLARMRMALELIDAHPDAAARQEIARSIHELDQLVEEILLASRLDAQALDPGAIESVDLLGLLAEEAARVDAEIEDAAPEGAWLTPGVPRLLRRLVRNLLENARRHGGGVVRASLQREPPWLLLCIDDQGPGVPPAFRERIFEPFFRLPGATEGDGGVGLGLALVRTIAQRHGGRVDCIDSPLGGARLRVWLKLDAGPGT